MVLLTERLIKASIAALRFAAELDEANDFVSMTEVLGRRYSPERMADERYHDLIWLVVDGSASADCCNQSA